MMNYNNEFYRVRWNNDGPQRYTRAMLNNTRWTFDNDYTIAARDNMLIIQDNNKSGSIKKAYRVEDNREFTYKVMKTKIKASGGAAGLYAFLKRNIEDRFAEIWTYNCIKAILENCREA